jgi:hypothetical protein
MISISYNSRLRLPSIFGKFLGNKRRRTRTTNIEHQWGLVAPLRGVNRGCRWVADPSRDEGKRRSCQKSEQTRNDPAFIA